MITEKIGIIGTGHLGLSIIQKLLEKGYNKNNLLLTHKNNPKTIKKLKQLKLTENITTNQILINNSDILILTIPPQNFHELDKLIFEKSKIIISFMASITNKQIQEQTKQKKIIRVLPTGPDTILNETAIAGLYPPNKKVEQLLKTLKIEYYPIQNDTEMNIMTIAACLPAAYSIINPQEKENKKAIQKFAKQFKYLPEISLKAEKIVPETNQEEYIKKMSTPGGITEEIVNSLKQNDSLYIALEKGLRRVETLQNDMK
ncbi:MAG: NAD(P)-binding domain-containing protein [Methanobacteriaceae archaeon]|nr:NAD(P)-binding domain-containing protein [Methanobacteriaceae archaeon]